MKVLMTTDTIGGVWTYTVELARALMAQGVRVSLATMGEPLSDDQLQQVDELHLDVHESVFKLEWMHEPWAELEEAGQWLLELEQRLAPNVIHLNGYAHVALPWQAPTLVVAHSCVCSWWQAVYGEEPPTHWDRYRRMVARGLASADLVLAPTWAMLSSLERSYGRLQWMGVISNGRDADLFPPQTKEPFVFCAGRVWDPAKNVAALDAAAGSLKWPVYAAGDEHHPGSGERVTLGMKCLGRLPAPEVADWLGRASIYALPARYEPFGLSALEAALAGCALVLGDLESLREVWGDTAVYVPPNDAEALADAINGLIDDPFRRATLAQMARRRALNLTPRRMADGYLRAYRLLLSRDPLRAKAVGARSEEG